MLRNYLTVALRQTARHKAYSFINLFGLSIGLACTLLILLWVKDELSYDRFHSNAGSLFRVEQDQTGPQGTFHVNATPYPMGPGLKDEIPEIQDATRHAFPGVLLVRQGSNVFFEERVRAVDPSFLKMFTFPSIRGDAQTALNHPRSIVLTDEMARKYFGNQDPLGKTLTVNNDYPFSVTGVVAKVPANSTVRFDMLVPLDFIKELGLYNDSWGDNEIFTWVQLQPESRVALVNEKITRLRRDRQQQEFAGDAETLEAIRKRAGPQFMLRPLTDIHLYSVFGFGRRTGTVQYVYIFSAIAVFVLLIACMNFMNLATARAANRAKEVGLRKTLGAFRADIARQFLGESMVTTLLAAGISMVFAALLLPTFNRLSGKELTASALLTWDYLLGVLAVAVVAGTVSGSYPAALLSAFQPVRVLRGGPAAGQRGALFRKSLVVLQFSLSVLLLVGTGVAYRQFNYMRSKSLGYDKEHLIYVPLRGDAPKAYLAFKEELLRDPRVLGVTGTYQEPTYMSSNSWGVDWDGKDPNQRVLIGSAFVDFDYTETMGIEMVAGRPLSRTFAVDNGESFLVNEEVPKLMGLDAAAAVGKRFSFQGVDGTIVGVMKNYHYQPLQYAIEPLAVLVAPEALQFAVVKLRPGDIPGALAYVRSTWEKVVPSYPYEQVFFDQDFGQMYASDERLATILKYFAAMAVVIACMGLFELASYAAQQRTKEIGVRKALGASVPGILRLLLKDFARCVLLANAIAWPVAYAAAQMWLQSYANRTTVGVWTFAGACALTLVVALITVSLQALKAARTNPVDSLRYE
ncbi:MAG: ABC transporter permease [Acidobacteriota bacterium]